MIAQHQSKIRNQAYDSEMVKSNMAIKPKQGQVSSIMDLAKIYREMGNNAKAIERIEEAEVLLEKIGTLGKKILHLKSSRSDISPEVDEYLERSRLYMVMKDTEQKKNKSKAKETREAELFSESDSN